MPTVTPLLFLLLVLGTLSSSEPGIAIQSEQKDGMALILIRNAHSKDGWVTLSVVLKNQLSRKILLSRFELENAVYAGGVRKNGVDLHWKPDVSIMLSPAPVATDMMALESGDSKSLALSRPGHFLTKVRDLSGQFTHGDVVVGVRPIEVTDFVSRAKLMLNPGILSDQVPPTDHPTPPPSP